MTSTAPLWAFDLGQSLGWCIIAGGKRRHGVISLAVKDSHAGKQYRRMVMELDILEHDNGTPATVHYEYVGNHRGPQGKPNWHAAHKYGAYLGILQYWAQTRERQPPLFGWPIQTIKSYATGRGDAKKDSMLIALNHLGLGHIKDHNEADAIWLAELASRTPKERWPQRTANGKRLN